MTERIRPSSSSSSKFPGLIISNLVFTDVKLGRGAYATVYAVEWNGTVCAAKRLHEILLEDESAGGVAKLIGNFEAECLTWSKLRHPGVVQFLGVYLEGSSRLPVSRAIWYPRKYGTPYQISYEFPVTRSYLQLILATKLTAAITI